MKRRSMFALLLAGLLLLASCGGKEDEDKAYQLGDKVATAFFDYTVDSAVSAKSYQGHWAAEGKQLILVELTIKNTRSYNMPMGRYDFLIQWSDEDEAFEYPLEQYCQSQLADEYEIPVNEKVQGLLIFEVPEEEEDFSLGFLEIYEDNSEGNAYFTYFTP